MEPKFKCDWPRTSTLRNTPIIYIYNLKQCENSPTNTIISMNFEDHDRDHGIRQIIYKKQCKTQKPTRKILKQAFDLLFQIFLRPDRKLPSIFYELIFAFYTALCMFRTKLELWPK